MRLAYDIWSSLHEEIGGFTGYRRLGHLDLIEREEDLAMAQAQGRRIELQSTVEQPSPLPADLPQKNLRLQTSRQ